MKGLLAAAVAVALVFSGCGTFRDLSDERYVRNNEGGRAWLSDQMLPPEINISGAWTSDDWGKADFVQTGNAVRGRLGDYPVEGVVSGGKAYLLASEGGWYQYSVILEMPDPALLLGYYSRSVPYHSSGRSDIRLDRTR